MQEAARDLLETIKTRRSTRNYRPDTLPDEVLGKIIEAGQYAPSGGNNQTTHFIAITSQEALGRLRDVITGVLANTPVREGMPPPLVGLIKKAQQGPVDVNYGAPVLVLTANKKGYANALADCSCALMNMMLMATKEDVGSCWINQYRLMGEAPPLQSFMKELGMQADEEIYGALVLGYTDNMEKEPLPRKGNPVTYVR